MQLEQRSGTGRRCPLGVHRLLQFARQVVDVFRVAKLQRLAQQPAQVGLQAGSGVGGFDAFAVIDPAQTLQVRVLVDQRFCAKMKLVGIYFMVGDVPRDPHELFLALKQPQSQPLLGVFDVPLNRLVFAVDFFQPEVGKRRNDRCKKKQYCRQWGQNGKTILPVRVETPPPTPDPLRRGYFQCTVRGRVNRHKLSVGESARGNPIQLGESALDCYSLSALPLYPALKPGLDILYFII